jgi:hypothetical protein
MARKDNSRIATTFVEANWVTASFAGNTKKEARIASALAKVRVRRAKVWPAISSNSKGRLPTAPLVPATKTRMSFVLGQLTGATSTS